MAKKGCELCKNAARMFCESDQASLCWDCDEKVHAANFLVAKHSRTLLCHVCHSPTPWKAAGPKLGPTVSVCHACAVHREKDNQAGASASASASASTGRPDVDEFEAEACESESDGGGEEIYTDSEEDEDEEEEDEEEVEEEDGENQVVPWSAGSGGLDSPPSSSGSEGNVSLSSSKRSRDCTFESSEDEEGSCSSQDLDYKSAVEESHCSSLSLFRPSKMSRQTGMMSPERGSAAIVEKLRRFQKEISTENAEAMVLSLCKLTRE